VFYRIGVLLAEIDPGHAFEKGRKLWGVFAIGKDCRDNGTVSLYKLSKECIQFLILPGTSTVLADEDGGGFDFAYLLFEQWLPWQSRA